MMALEKVTEEKYEYAIQTMVVVNLLTAMPISKENIQEAKRKLDYLDKLYDEIYPIP